MQNNKERLASILNRDFIDVIEDVHSGALSMKDVTDAYDLRDLLLVSALPTLPQAREGSEEEQRILESYGVKSREEFWIRIRQHDESKENRK